MKVALLLNSLSTLPCFNKIKKITPISGGLSHDCFKVEADNTCFFAKNITGAQLKNEVLLAQISSTERLSPNIYYSSEQWIISDFIEGGNLAISGIPLIDKISMSIALMTKFHQISLYHPEEVNGQTINTLSITDTISGLFHPKNSPILISEVTKIARNIEVLVKKSVNKSKPVCCHSDLNFSNVLTDNNTSAWLIDFEYACFAPVEFDLAMLITINNIPTNAISTVINLYELQVGSQINNKSLQHYILFCFLINGLWYFNRSLDEVLSLEAKAQQQMIKLATEQWQAFDILYNKLGMSKDIITLQKFI
jgi:thiamine kinase-like enzyme